MPYYSADKKFPPRDPMPQGYFVAMPIVLLLALAARYRRWPLFIIYMLLVGFVMVLSYSIIILNCVFIYTYLPYYLYTLAAMVLGAVAVLIAIRRSRA